MSHHVVATMCCRQWVNDPAAAKAHVELLTRDADLPEEASTASVAPPPPSKLVAETLGLATGAANGAARGITNGVAGLKLGMKGAVGGIRAAAAQVGA